MSDHQWRIPRVGPPEVRAGRHDCVDRIEEVGAELHVGRTELGRELLHRARSDDRRGDRGVLEHPCDREVDERDACVVGERAERVSTLQQVVEEAARWFQKQLRLPVGRQGLDYLRGRGLEEATIDDFRLGFAPDTRDGLLAALKREGVPVDKIVEAGLVIQPEDNREPYDRFRGRVMFPINDRRGRVIAFGGRVMGAGEPKYLNSPETPLFHKGANLYCLDRARVAATKDQPVIVAEGYMDVIALHGAGFSGAVAPLGTALTEGQLGELWKLADEPFLCFDGDNAGRRAAQRAAERALPLLRPGKSLRFLALPAGEDPDSLIRVRGADAIRRIVELARPLSDVVWEMETEGKVADTPERRASLQRAVEQRVAEIADPKKPLGSNVFVLEKGDEDGFTWQATGYSTGKGAKKPSTAIVERVTPPPGVQAAIDERMTPGMVFVTTDELATPETRSGKDFTVMDSEEKKN